LLIIEVGVDGSCVGVVMEVMDIDTGDICGLVGEIEASTAMDSRVMTIGTGVLVWDKGVSVESEVLAGAVVDVSVGTTAAAIGGTRVRVGGIGVSVNTTVAIVGNIFLGVAKENPRNCSIGDCRNTTPKTIKIVTTTPDHTKV